MRSTMKYTLVTSAFNQAYGREHPEQGLLVHTDQGSQYTSGPFVRLLNQRHCIHSMSHKGNPYDNAVSEYFFKTLKRELVNEEHYADHDRPAGVCFVISKHTIIIKGFIPHWAG